MNKIVRNGVLTTLAVSLLSVLALAEDADPLDKALNHPAIVKGTVVAVTPDEDVPALKIVKVRIDYKYSGGPALKDEFFEAYCGIEVMHNGEVIPYIPKLGETAVWLVNYTLDAEHENMLPVSTYLQNAKGLTGFPGWDHEKKKYAEATALAEQVEKVVALPAEKRREALMALTQDQRETVAAWAYGLIAQFDPAQRAQARSNLLARVDISDSLLGEVLRGEDHFPVDQRLPAEQRKAFEERLAKNEKARRAADPDAPKLIIPDAIAPTSTPTANGSRE